MKANRVRQKGRVHARVMGVFWLLFLVMFLLGARGKAAGEPSATGAQAAQRPVVVTLRLEGPLTPVMLEHLKRAEQAARQLGAAAIVVGLDTPGGSTDLMTTLVEQIRASSTPIIVYVSPRGAMAGSAGTLVTLAGHAAAMAPETTIGAASPVGSQGEDIGATLESKIKEITKASARSLAADRPQKAVDLAQEMIDNARAVSVDEALSVGLVDAKATSVEDLLQQMDGRQVRLQDQMVTLHTAGAQTVPVDPTFMEELLTILSNPNLVFLLLAVGVQALLIEISSPGGWVAGTVGVVCILLAVYGLGVLPVNWFGLLFIGLAFVLFILDVKAPTHGALTAAGVGAFIVGALILFNSPNVPQFQRVSVPLVVGTGLSLGAIFFTLVGYALRARHLPLRMGNQTLIGQTGTVNTALNPTGTVQIGSELWTAVLVDDGPPLPRGAQVQVVGIESLQVRVTRMNQPLSDKEALPWKNLA